MPVLRSLTVLILYFFAVTHVQAKISEQPNNHSTIVLKFPGSSSENWQAIYPVQLMQLALSKVAEGQYQLAPSDTKVPKGRNFQLLTEGKQLHVMWSTATQERVDNYHAVPFPIMKGLFGLRVALVHQSQLNLFESVKTIEDLRFFVPGQMHIWTDAKIFQHNQIQVYNSPGYEILFEMLANKRFDYFPRAVVEAVAELNERPELPIALDKHLLFRYPTALYFYVHNEALAKLLLSGLEATVKSGEFEQLFRHHHAAQLQKLNLDDRTIIQLDNPFAPTNLPLNRGELWLTESGVNGF